MIRVIGNSHERVPILDLKDVVYYKQTKEYTDQEYSYSKDLKREIQGGRLIVLERIQGIRGSEDTRNSPVEKAPGDSVNLNDLRLVLKEILPEFKNGISEDSLKGAIREIAPLIVSMVRQEISSIKTTQQVIETPIPGFQGPEYVPSVSTEGMISNVKAKENKVSADSAEDALSVLRKLKK